MNYTTILCLVLTLPCQSSRHDVHNLQYGLGSHSSQHVYSDVELYYSTCAIRDCGGTKTHVTFLMSSPLEATSVAMRMGTRPVSRKTHVCTHISTHDCVHSSQGQRMNMHTYYMYVHLPVLKSSKACSRSYCSLQSGDRLNQ